MDPHTSRPLDEGVGPTQTGTNTPQAGCQISYGQMSKMTFFYHKPILSQAITTYQGLMLVTDAQGSSSLIAFRLCVAFPVLSLPLQTAQCHGFYLTLDNESFLIHLSPATISVNLRVNIREREAQVCHAFRTFRRRFAAYSVV